MMNATDSEGSWSDYGRVVKGRKVALSGLSTVFEFETSEGGKFVLSKADMDVIKKVK